MTFLEYVIEISSMTAACAEAISCIVEAKDVTAGESHEVDAEATDEGQKKGECK